MSNLLFAPDTVIGFHGCALSDAESILTAGDFRPSANRYDWLGRGVYFWEYAPYRALEWARLIASLRADKPAVLRATIRLGFCVNLLDSRHIPGLAQVYNELAEALPALPINSLQGAHFLDRLVIDTYSDFFRERYHREIETVRGCFPEGIPIFHGSRILSKAHVQIAVRDLRCIQSIELVSYPQEEAIS